MPALALRRVSLSWCRGVAEDSTLKPPEKLWGPAPQRGGGGGELRILAPVLAEVVVIATAATVLVSC